MTTQYTLQRMADRCAIQDCLQQYARGVDRGDWDLVRYTYHPDAIDHHSDYHGDIDGLIDWLDVRFKGVDNSSHFLGNCLIEFDSDNTAFVETYFVSRRLQAPSPGTHTECGPNDQVCREVWGRYADHFERRNGEWKVSRRVVIVEASSSSIAIGGKRSVHSPVVWGARDRSDVIYQSRSKES